NASWFARLSSTTNTVAFCALTIAVPPAQTVAKDVPARYCRRPSGRAWLRASEHAPDLPRHVGLAERLHQQVDPGIEPAVVDDGVARVAGGEKHLEIGASSMRFVGELSPVDAVR